MEHSSIQKRLRFSQGSNYFRQRLIFSLLSARPVKIEEIRAQLSAFELNVGVASCEMSFIHLLDSLSNGSKFKISETGTEVSLVPGVLVGGSVTHSCDTTRPISYYLEPVLLLAPFCKKPLYLTLKGRLQNDKAGYNSIYKIKHAALPIMDKFGLEVDLLVKSRGYDDSEVIFQCTVKKQLLTLRSQYSQDIGKVKKIRGLAYGFRMPPQLLSRIIIAAKGEFLSFINDVFLINDPIRHSKSKVPGYGLVLYAETTKGIVYAADDFVGREDLDKREENSAPMTVQTRNLDGINTSGGGDDAVKKTKGFELFPSENADTFATEEDEKREAKRQRLLTVSKSETSFEQTTVDESSSLRKKRSGGTENIVTSPEELGLRVSRMLLKEISTQSRVDSVYQYLILGMMALSPRDVSSVVLGPLTPFTVQFLRDLKAFFGVTFKVENYKEKKVKKVFSEKDEGNIEEDESEEEENDNNCSQLYKLTCLGSGYINLNKTTM